MAQISVEIIRLPGSLLRGNLHWVEPQQLAIFGG
jgi:hypothetical protein